MKTVHVAAGIIRNPQDNSVLAVQRGYGDMQGLWEFPGGKVQRGETAYDACIRELQEELCVEVHNLRAFYTVEYDYEAFHLSMECFFCDIARGKVSAADQQKAIRWVPQRSLADLTWMPADVELVRALIAAAKATHIAREIPDVDLESPTSKRPSSAKKRTKKSLVDTLDIQGLSASETELVRRRAAIKKSMQGNKRANTRPEMLVRQRLRQAGLTGYRLQWNKAPAGRTSPSPAARSPSLSTAAFGTAARTAIPASLSETLSFGRRSSHATSHAMPRHKRSSLKPAGRASLSGNANSSAIASTRQWNALSTPFARHGS